MCDDAAISLNVPPEQLNLIDRAAYLLGKSRSDFILETACGRAQSVVIDHLFGNVGGDKFEQFSAMLDAPLTSNPGLERLMSVTPPWRSN